MSTTHTVPTGTMTAQLADVKEQLDAQAESQFIYFDLREELDSLCTEQLRANLLASYAWGIDTRLINAGRALFWQLREDQETLNGIEAFNDYRAKIADLDFREKALEDTGSDGTGLISLIRQLADLRVDAHALAMQASLNPAKYVEPSIEDVLKADKPMRLQPESKARLRKVAEALAPADADAEAIDQIHKILIEKDAFMRQANFERRAEINPIVSLLISDVCRLHGTDGSASFHTLPIPVQISLIQQSIRKLESEMVDAATNTRISVSVFGALVYEAKSAVKRLNKVLQAEKYNRS